MKPIEQVRMVAYDFISSTECVRINEDAIAAVANELINSPLCEWRERWPRQRSLHDTILFELTVGAINYCYWYGRHDIRPGGASASTTYKIVNKWEGSWGYLFITWLYEQLVIHRFPLLEERYRHLRELTHNIAAAEEFANIITNSEDTEAAFDHLIKSFPGYGGDIFLKRAQLLIMQIHRKTKLLSVQDLTLPADYQVPKILRHKGCIEYCDTLSQMIRSHQLIPRGSEFETAIRAATIYAGDKIAKATNTNAMVVDNFLWQSRKQHDGPFHLTITTDY